MLLETHIGSACSIVLYIILLYLSLQSGYTNTTNLGGCIVSTPPLVNLRQTCPDLQLFVLDY